jgi:protein-disulfide isomerase
LVITTYLTVLHYQAGTNGIIDAPFCGEGTVINCNAVLSSPYAQLFGQPIALWGAIAYVAVLLASFLNQAGLLVMLCGWAFVLSLYLAGISLFVIKSFCLLCASLYAVNTGLLIGAVALGRGSATMTARRVAYSVAGYVILTAGIGWFQSRAAASIDPAQFLTEQNLSAIDADFVRYYNSRPQVTLKGAERHTEGPPQALLTISEFVDFRCPQCARARETLSQFQQSNPDKVRVVFRHYPLDQACNSALSQQVHPGACAGAFAAECAGEQGKFWEYADILFADQKQYTRQDLQNYARTVGLDVERFTQCMNDGRTTSLVRADIEEAERINVKATPTLVINGHLIEGLLPPQKLSLILALEQQQATKK